MPRHYQLDSDEWELVRAYRKASPILRSILQTGIREGVDKPAQWIQDCFDIYRAAHVKPTYQCTRCGLTCSAGDSITCPSGPCPMEPIIARH